MLESLPPQRLPRRRFLRRAATLGASVPFATGLWARVLAQTPCSEGSPAGSLVRNLALYGPGAQDAPLGRLVGGSGLDARLFTDVSTLSSDGLITPTERVFVRTTAPSGLDLEPRRWRIAFGAGEGASVSATDLAADARAMGAHLIECAGNSNPQHFGLMSAVDWSGVPLARMIERMPRPSGPAASILIEGADPLESQAGRSVPGASWILSVDDIDRYAPFLATAMNGRPLTADHGAPVRLVVPGWYGCTWIKWVTSLRWVGSAESSTSQMLEYAARTHQDGRPPLAGDYAPPAVDTAAMPIRVEQRRVDGALVYDVVGILWGGDRPVERLAIRFGRLEPWIPMPVCPPPTSTRTWALWRYRWRPPAAGYYDITLKVADPSVRTRRLDLSFYIRRVRIDEV